MNQNFVTHSDLFKLDLSIQNYKYIQTIQYINDKIRFDKTCYKMTFPPRSHILRLYID